MSGDTPLRTESDDWFAGTPDGPSTPDDDWVTDETVPRPPPPPSGPAARRLSRRTTLIAALVLVVLVAAGVVLAVVLTGGKKNHAAPPAASSPTTTQATTTTRPATTPSAPPGPTVTLKPGDTGTQVKRLQRFLRLFGYSTAAVDGIYGPATQAAVKRFQQATNLTADGIVGPATLRAVKAALGTKR